MGARMQLTEQGAVPLAALPIAAFRDHLRLGSGFSSDGMQDSLLEQHLRAAIAVIEGRIGKVLVTRRFLWVLRGWRGVAAQALPVAPVAALAEVALVDAAGGRVVMAPAAYRLAVDTHRPKLVALSGVLPVVPQGGQIEIAFDAGFGGHWGAVPADLAQAVLLLAAEFYETRSSDAARPSGLPLAVQSLIERWRTVRVLGGKPCG